MTAYMAAFMIVLELLACYFPAVSGAHGRGSRKLWIGLIFFGLIVSFGMMMLAQALNVVIPSPDATARLLEIILRTALALAIGAFLATLLYKKKPSVEDLGLK
jgi:hypothetical protein